jgi:hypothetical protein
MNELAEMRVLLQCRFSILCIAPVQLTQQSRESGVQTQLARNRLSVHRDLRASPKFLESKSPENHVHES